VVIAEFEMDRVLAYEFYLSKLEAVGDMNWKNDAITSHFILTGCTGTQTAKQWSQMPGFMPIGPQNLNFTRAQLLDLRWSRGV